MTDTAPNLLADLIASKRAQAATIESAPQPEKPTTAERAKRLVDLESSKQMREWADFAEKGMK